MADIKKALPYILANEGGAKYTNNPKDPGGPTKYGVTLKALAEWRHRTCRAQDVANLSEDEACDIYKAHYWDVLLLDAVEHQGTATAIFDVSVNRGPGVAKRYTLLAVDRINKQSFNDALHTIPFAVNQSNSAAFIKEFEEIVEQGYRAIVSSHPEMGWALKGWLNRAKRLLSLR